MYAPFPCAAGTPNGTAGLQPEVSAQKKAGLDRARLKVLAT